MKCICTYISNSSALGIQNIPNQESSKFFLFGKNPPPNLMQITVKVSG